MCCSILIVLYSQMASCILPSLPSYIPAQLPLNKLTSSLITPTHAHSLRRAVITACSTENRVLPQQQRRSADYQPPLWDYNYIQSLGSHHMDDGHAKRIDELKEEVRHMFVKEEDAVYRLQLIDALRQLGVAYHFEEEIKDAMGSMPVSAEDVVRVFKDDLNALALLFRLHREHGVLISQDVFEGFKDENGDFKACLCQDTKGMLSMYEASHLAVKGEELLHDVKAFTTRHLRGLLEQPLDPQLRERVAYALELPLNFRTPRLHARLFIDAYARDDDMNPVLLELAELDFNMVQHIHQTELKELWRWWSNLGLGQRLGFARDRLMECFLFAVGWAFEPKLSRCREGVTKITALITDVDDIYDVYGSINELELFTRAIVRWDVAATEELPGYMKMCYLALINTVNSLAYDILNEKGLDTIPYTKKAWAILCKSYLTEAKWYHTGYVPTFEEYRDNAQITTGIPLILTYTHLCVSQNITEETLECIFSCSDIIQHASIIFRLWNDFGTSMAELKRGDVPKAIQCHMHENVVSKAIACQQIEVLINNLWGELNGDRYTTIFDESFLNIALNFPRMAQYMYQNRDGFGQPDQESMARVASLLIEPILVKGYDLSYLHIVDK